MGSAGADHRVVTPDERAVRQLRFDARELLAEAEDAAAEFEAASRTLRDALIDIGRQGSTLTIETAAGTIEGSLEHVGLGVATIGTRGGQTVSIALDGIVGVRIAGERGSASSVTVGHPHTLEALLREAVQTEAAITVHRVGGHPVVGQVLAVAPTHVELQVSTATWLVPLAALVFVTTG